MSTFKEIIARVDEIKPNAFSENLKLNWLTGLNGKIAADVFLMDIAEIRELPHGAEAIDCKPLIGFPHEEVYDEYLAAKIDAANGEASEYQNRMQIYDAYYMNFVIWFKSIYDPVQGNPRCHGLRPKLPTYYITAYGLAVMKGFTGTLEQWLESLTAYGVARNNGFEGTAADWLESLTAYGVARKQGFEGSAEDWLESIKGESLAAKVEEIPGGYRVTITDAKGAHSFDVMNGVGAVSSVGGLLPDKDGNVALTVGGVAPDQDGNIALTVGGVAPDQDGNIALTVANIAPDENGNIPLKPKDIGAFPKTGGAVEGPIDMGGQKLSGLNDPEEDDEAATKEYVDTAKGEAATYTDSQVRRASPTNLLDNSDFRNPVNQRGNTTYNGSVYTIDRWKMWNEDSNGILTVNNGYITLANAGLYQYLEKADASAVYTLAVKFVGEDPTVVSGTFAENASNDRIGFNFVNSKYEVKILNDSDVEWAALYKGEYTADTLPEYQPKGYGAELAECMRYFYSIKAPLSVGAILTGHCYTAEQARFVFRYPHEMRVRPTFTYSSAGSDRLIQNNAQVNAGDVSSLDGNVSCMTLSVAASGLTPKAICGLTAAGSVFAFSADL